MRNDRFPAAESGGDRTLYFASRGIHPEVFQFFLLRTYPCAGGIDPPIGETPECDLNTEVDGELYARSVVVRYADASLELVTLYVAVEPDRATLLDQNG